MSKIYDLPLSYRLSKKYVDFTFKVFYRDFIILGCENIPDEGPIIFAPNHRNALMDALAILYITPDRYSVSFLARADIFKKKMIAAIMNSLKIMPAFRIRDGISNLGRNADIFDKCIELLDHKNALCMMPEGNQELPLNVRPLVKGIFRIAFSTQEKAGTDNFVKIIPVGLDYGDLTKFGKHILINIGKPIEVSEYMEQYTLNPVTATNEIRDRLRNALIDLTVHLDSEQYYDCYFTATEIANIAILKDLGLKDSTTNRFKTRQEIGRRLEKLEKNEPETIRQLDLLCKKYVEKNIKIKLKADVIEAAPYKVTGLLGNAFLLFATLPVFVYGLVVNLLPFFIPVLMRKHVFKAEFTGFFSSLQYGVGIITFPLFYALQAILFGCFISPTWYAILLFLFSQYFMGKWAFGWYRKAKKFSGKLKFSNMFRKKSADLAEILHLHKQIVDIVSKANH